MKTSLFHFLVSLTFAQSALANEKVMPLEERLGRNWNVVKFAYGTDDGCTGLMPHNEFTIARDGANKKTISTTAMFTERRFSTPNPPRPKLISTPPVSLSEELYEAIPKDFLEHLEQARKEMNVGESLVLRIA